MRRWEPIHEHLTRFQRDYGPPTMPPLALVAATDRTWSDAEYRQRKPAGFPGGLRGVYLLFGADEALLYVGVAMWSFDKRVWSHDTWIERRFIDIIPFEERWLPLALSLEFFLIQALSPPSNTVYRGYGIGCDHDPIPNPPKLVNG